MPFRKLQGHANNTWDDIAKIEISKLYLTFNVVLYYILLGKNKIEGTPILKLAMVKRLKVKKNSE